MLGAIAGDIIGSVHEHAGTKTKHFPLFTPHSRFTDDSILTIAVADGLLRQIGYVDCFHEYFSAYPDAGYGASFMQWAHRRIREPYNSYGNGSAMRISPVAYVCNTVDDVLVEAERCAAVTHNHPEGIKGAQAAAAAVFLARTGASKAEIKRFVEKTFGYDLAPPLDDVRRTYSFDVTCQSSVPEAMIAFLASTDFEDAVRNAISLGGDADTLACIAGAIAEPFYGGVPPHVLSRALPLLDDRLRAVIDAFQRQFRMVSSAGAGVLNP